jgi:hypothetical protein
MRIIAAEVAIAPQNQLEVELGMLPLDVDLPGPPPGMRSSGVVTVRLTLHTSRGDLTIKQQLALEEEDTLGPAQAPVPDARFQALPFASVLARRSPEDLAVGRAQYEALLRSVERRYEPIDPGVSGFHARLPRRPYGPGDNAMAIFKEESPHRRGSAAPN